MRESGPHGCQCGLPGVDAGHVPEEDPRLSLPAWIEHVIQGGPTPGSPALWTRAKQKRKFGQKGRLTKEKKKRGDFLLQEYFRRENYSLKLIPKNRRRVKLQALLRHINSKTIELQRVKTVIILQKMVSTSTFRSTSKRAFFASYSHDGSSCSPTVVSSTGGPGQKGLCGLTHFLRRRGFVGLVSEGEFGSILPVKAKASSAY